MSNSHGIPDTLKELQATDGDLLAPCILSTTWPVVPASSLTLAAFATYGYARSGRDLVYIDQPAVTVTLPSAAGTYWLGLHRDTSSAVSGWTRRDGSHYVFQVSASQPTPPDGVVLLSSVTVAGSVITAVAQTGILRAPMSRQDASAVAITGGSISLPASAPGPYIAADAGAGTQVGFRGVVNAGTGKYNLLMDGTAQNFLAGNVGIGAAPLGSTSLLVTHTFGLTFGLWLRRTDGGASASNAAVFALSNDSIVGSISVTQTATAYNTSSDVRLKRHIQPLTDSLALIRRLNPISHLWNADDSYGENFLAHELQREVPLAVTGEPDALNPDGSVNPQQVDASKLIPRLTAALQELAAQLDAAVARIATLEQSMNA